MQEVLGFGPLRTGLLFLPMTGSIIIASQLSSRLVSRFGPRPVLIVGMLFTAAGFLWMGQLDATSTYANGLLGGAVFATFGVGLSFTPLAMAATSGVPPHQAGLASGLLNTSRQVGGSIGLAALATLATARTQHLTRGRDGTGRRANFGLRPGLPRQLCHRAGGSARGGPVHPVHSALSASGTRGRRNGVRAHEGHDAGRHRDA